MKSKKTKKRSNKTNTESKKTQPNSTRVVIYVVFAIAICAICLLLAFRGANNKDDDSNNHFLVGEWKDIMTDSSIKFDGENFYLEGDGPYRYTYDEEKQMVYIEYMGGYINTLKCNYVDGYWKLTTSEDGKSFAYVPLDKRDELRSKTIAEKWENHTKDRTEVVLGQTYTTADGITFTITGGEMKNTPDIKDSSAVINLYIDCDVEINVENWKQSSLRTPYKDHYENTYFDNGADVVFYQNITGVTELGKAPHDYCILQFDFGGSKYYLDVLKLNLIAE